MPFEIVVVGVVYSTLTEVQYIGVPANTTVERRQRLGSTRRSTPTYCSVGVVYSTQTGKYALALPASHSPTNYQGTPSKRSGPEA